MSHYQVTKDRYGYFYVWDSMADVPVSPASFDTADQAEQHKQELKDKDARKDLGLSSF